MARRALRGKALADVVGRIALLMQDYDWQWEDLLRYGATSELVRMLLELARLMESAVTVLLG